MNLLNFLTVNLAAALVVMILAWLTHLLLGKASVADSFWGPGFGAIAWLSFVLGQGDATRKTCIAVLVFLWAIRLAFHVTRRNWGRVEDPRYTDMRARHPESFWIRSLPKVFLLQGLLLWVVSLPVQWGMRQPGPEALTFLDGLGICLWIFGFFWEAVGDEQLYRFKSNPDNRGKILDRGLWRYTRHPNYFGETVMWWALFLMALPVHGGWLTFIGPLLLTVLLLRVSGVRLTEKKMNSTYSELADYRRRVSPFFPLPPKDPKG